MFNKINELLENKLYIEARREIAEMNPVDIAALIEEFPKDERTKIFRLLPKSLAPTYFPISPLNLNRTSSLPCPIRKPATFWII